MFYEWFCIENIREMVAYKILVTFDSKESLEEALAIRMDILFNLFHEVRKWFKDE